MSEYNLQWDVNLRTVFRLWPEATPNIEDMVSCAGQPYNEAAFVLRFRPGRGGTRSDDTRVIRNTREPLEQAGLAYRDGSPQQFLLTPLGECVLSFFGLTGTPRMVNGNNLYLPASLMIRAVSMLIEQRTILSLMRRTDNRLTNDELEQAMGLISRMSDIDAAAVAIMQARVAGTPVPVAADRNKITPQFLLAGGGGMFISVEQADAVRRIPDWAAPLIDECLAEDIPLVHASTSKDTVLRMSSHAAPQLDFGKGPFGPATDQKVREVVNALRRHGSDSIIALSGVPGTGKTFVALAAAHRFAGSPLLVETIQFHQSYTYEDFVEGLRPTLEGGFNPTDGIFLRWNEQALRDPDNKYVLLIEEFTRANISSVLGELMTYVEYRDRTFLTPLTRQWLQVASNLVILVTMNPRDRSALEVDDALLRRMRVIDCPPDTEQLKEMLQGSLSAGLDVVRRRKIIEGLVELFEVCEKKPNYADAMPFGHGIFAHVQDEVDLKELYDQRIRYLLRRPLRQPHEFAGNIETVLYRLFPPAGASAEDAPAVFVAGAADHMEPTVTQYGGGEANALPLATDSPAVLDNGGDAGGGAETPENGLFGQRGSSSAAPNGRA